MYQYGVVSCYKAVEWLCLSLGCGYTYRKPWVLEQKTFSKQSSLVARPRGYGPVRREVCQGMPRYAKSFGSSCRFLATKDDERGTPTHMIQHYCFLSREARLVLSCLYFCWCAAQPCQLLNMHGSWIPQLSSAMAWLANSRVPLQIVNKPSGCVNRAYKDCSDRC